MTKFNTSDKIYVGKSKIKNAGRGVFARVKINKGELIENCPVIEVPEGDVANLTDSILITYFYYLGENKERVFLALGFGSIYNHISTPNAHYVAGLENEMIDFVAIKDIREDDEITVNYNSTDSKIPLWFE
jgi:uncharacterized protein